jgi:hypothetical protein
VGRRCPCRRKRKPRRTAPHRKSCCSHEHASGAERTGPSSRANSSCCCSCAACDPARRDRPGCGTGSIAAATVVSCHISSQHAHLVTAEVRACLQHLDVPCAQQGQGMRPTSPRSQAGGLTERRQVDSTLPLGKAAASTQVTRRRPPLRPAYKSAPVAQAAPQQRATVRRAHWRPRSRARIIACCREILDSRKLSVLGTLIVLQIAEPEGAAAQCQKGRTELRPSNKELKTRAGPLHVKPDRTAARLLAVTAMRVRRCLHDAHPWLLRCASQVTQATKGKRTESHERAALGAAAYARSHAADADRGAHFARPCSASCFTLHAALVMNRMLSFPFDPQVAAASLLAREQQRRGDWRAAVLRIRVEETTVDHEVGLSGTFTILCRLCWG